MQMSHERKMVRIDLQDGFRRRGGKACPTCGAGASRPAEAAPTTDEYVAKASIELRVFQREGWELDLSHADTQRFKNAIDSRQEILDLVFVVALVRT